MASDTILLFDVDGTLTKPRNTIEPNMLKQLLQLQSQLPVAVVSGSDFGKVCAQLGGLSGVSQFAYTFSENGLVVHQFGKQIRCTSIVDKVGEEVIQKFINYCLGYLSNLWLPLKRGTFIEFRKGLINVSPIGRGCSQEERDAFEKYDRQHGIRQSFVEDMRAKFSSSGLEFAIGGQISIDVYPSGWDKRYCLQFLENFRNIHFFGDRTCPGGNDYEIFMDERTIGHAVTSPADTSAQLRQLFPHLHQS